MTMQPLFQWIEATELAMWINNSKYAFAVIECFHILALAVIGGAVRRRRRTPARARLPESEGVRGRGRGSSVADRQLDPHHR